MDTPVSPGGKRRVGRRRNGGKGRDPAAGRGLCRGPPASGLPARAGAPVTRYQPRRGPGRQAPAGPASRGPGACEGRAGSPARAPACPPGCLGPRLCQESYNLASALPDREKPDRALTRAQSPRSPAHSRPARRSPSLCAAWRWGARPRASGAARGWGRDAAAPSPLVTPPPPHAHSRGGL